MAWHANSPHTPSFQTLQETTTKIYYTETAGKKNNIYALASFLSLVLSGRTPLSIRPYFFGANLFALEKKDGGVRPIAVGCTLRRLAAKVASGKVLEDMAALLAPRQLGFGVKGGVEAAVHCARLYLRNLKPQQVLLKLDFKNAFNSLRRDKMLSAVQVLAPTILPFVHSAYSSTSFLFWDDKSIQSCEGIPLAPSFFVLLSTSSNLVWSQSSASSIWMMLLLAVIKKRFYTISKFLSRRLQI